MSVESASTSDHPPIDRALFAGSLFLLACLGVVAVHTSSITTRQPGFEPIYLSKHLAHLGLGVGVAIWGGTRRPDYWRRRATVAGALVVLALLLVLVPGVGLSAGGATRWLRLPGFSVQPSEWAKLAIALVVVGRYCQRTRPESRRRQIRLDATAVLLVVAMMVLVLKQPDLGTCVLLATAAVVSLWLAGLRARWFAGAALLALPALATLSLHGYQLRRINGLLDAWRDWNDAPYQLRQSLIALGEGGLNGVGLGRGWQKLSFLPESHTDFVVAVIGEEMGFVGILAIATFWISLLASGYSMASRCENEFARSVTLTILLMVVLQAALNVAVVAAVIPPTGIPHPLLSHGGNSLLVTMLGMGIVWSLTSAPLQRQCTSESLPLPRDRVVDLETCQEAAA